MRTAALVAAIVLAVDQATKAWARSELPACVRPRGTTCGHVPVAGLLELVRIRNAGSAYGFSQGLWVWPVLAAFSLVVIVWLPRVSGPSAGMAVGTGLLLAGALGNLVDRVVLGGVTDFIGFDLGGSAGFSANLADLALVVGTVLATAALARGLFGKPRDEPNG